jgi:hypothetical protein
MSPTSYQTAPPRDENVSIGVRSQRVKRTLNNINALREGLHAAGKIEFPEKEIFLSKADKKIRTPI